MSAIIIDIIGSRITYIEVNFQSLLELDNQRYCLSITALHGN